VLGYHVTPYGLSFFADSLHRHQGQLASYATANSTLRQASGRLCGSAAGPRGAFRYDSIVFLATNFLGGCDEPAEKRTGDAKPGAEPPNNGNDGAAVSYPLAPHYPFARS